VHNHFWEQMTFDYIIGYLSFRTLTRLNLVVVDDVYDGRCTFEGCNPPYLCYNAPYISFLQLL
jgi:hypothetical protein